MTLEQELSAFLTIGNMILQFAYFALMCLGLVLASIFLYLKLLSGADYSMLCGILFGTGGFGHAIVNMGAAKRD